MNNKTNVFQKISFKQLIYLLCSISLIYIFFHYYFNISLRIFGIPSTIVYLITIYCIANSFKKINFKTVLISSIIASLFLTLFSFICPFLSWGSTFDSYFKISFIRSLQYIATGLLVIFIAFIVFKNDTHKDFVIEKSVIYLGIMIAMGILFCASITSNGLTFTYKEFYTLFIFFIISFFCRYYLYHISKKWYILGNILISSYFAVIGIVMFCLFVDEVSDSGWAITYILAIFYELLFVHLSISVVSSLIFLTPFFKKHVK